MKRIISIILTLMLGFMLTACNGGGGGETSEDTKSETFEYKVVIRGTDAPLLSEVISKINTANGKMLRIADCSSEEEDGEIVFGDSPRAVSYEAVGALDSLIAEATENADSGYLIYKDAAGNVAVCWSDEHMMELAIERFISDYYDLDVLSASVSGVIFYEVVNMDDYLYKTAWAKVDANAPADVADALKSLYAYIDGSVIADWMANLWEPFICACGKCDPYSDEISCYGGGFYYANSARDYMGFLPDLETTRQVISWMLANGALESADMIPEGVQQRIIQFCQACLDPNDGYFYHPQWGKNIGTARKGRDYNWGIELLNYFGATPRYPTAEDRLTGNTAANLTAPLGTSAVNAVSTIITTATSFEESLKSEDTYMEWLRDVTNGDDMFKNSAGAHTIESVRSQIKAAGYLKVTLDYLDAQQEKLFKEMKAAYDADPVNNPEPTGLWQRSVDYNAVWGLYKLYALYDMDKREIKYAEYAMKTCVRCILFDAEVGGNYHMNDVYNQWASARSLILNVTKHNPSLLPRLYEITNENAVQMITQTKAKLARFRQEDGTYSYNQGTSAPTTQGVPVSLGLPEGDVNATLLASSMYRAVFDVLGYDIVPLCDYRDGERFVEFIRNAESCYFTKQHVSPPEPLDFEEKPADMTETFNGGSSEIVDDPKGGDNKVLKVVCEPGSAGDTIIFTPIGHDKSSTRYIMEFDILVESVSATNWTGTIFQIRIGESYMIEIYNKNGVMYVRDNSSTTTQTDVTDLDIAFDMGKWVNIRIEYYVDSESPKIKIFFNDTLTAESTNYYGTTPRNIYTQARFFSPKATGCVVYLDNGLFLCERGEYTDSIYPSDYIPE